MADTSKTAPGPHPDAVVVNDDGTVTEHGRKAWIWCTDTSTGSRADYPASMLPVDGLVPVSGYPANLTRFGRPAKSRAELVGEADLDTAASRAALTVSSAPLAPVGDDENDAGADGAGDKSTTRTRKATAR